MNTLEGINLLNVKAFSKLKIVSETKLQEYLDFCSSHKLENSIKFKTELHHILPKSLFEEYSNLNIHKWNGINLLHKDHYIAHSLLVEALGEAKIVLAWWFMNNLNTKSNKISKPEKIIGEERYAVLREKAIEKISLYNKGKVIVIDECTGRQYRVLKEEFDNSPNLSGITKNKLTVTSIKSGEKIQIFKKDYNPDIHLFHTKDKVSVRKRDTLEWVTIDKNRYHKNKELYIHSSTGKVSVKTSNGKNISISKEDFKHSDSKGVASNTVSVFDLFKNINKRVSISVFENSKYLIGVSSYKFFIIDGIYMRSIDAEKYLLSKGYKSTVHNFERYKNKSKFIHNFIRIAKEEYIHKIKTLKEKNE